jgi:triphosphoribosyl-dephospho-CoA synthase
MAPALPLQSRPPVSLPDTRLPSSGRMLAQRAVGALVAEALLTPKPALVDRRGPGAHRDLDLTRLLRSAAALHSSFQRMADCAQGRAPSQSLREELASIGRRAETTMMAATGGSNAHRGAIWVLGLLVAARAMGEGSASGTTDSAGDRNVDPADHRAAGPGPHHAAGPGAYGTAGPVASAAEIAAIAATIARLPDRFAPLAASNGSRVCQRYGVAGARGEACDGFPHVVNIGLPALQVARSRGIGQTPARLDALMAIMASLEDTCLLHRGGRAALEAAQNGARIVLSCGGTSTVAGWSALLALDVDLLARNASPGGCADLLAACLFLDDEPTLEEVKSAWSN